MSFYLDIIFRVRYREKKGDGEKVSIYHMCKIAFLLREHGYSKLA